MNSEALLDRYSLLAVFEELKANYDTMKCVVIVVGSLYVGKVISKISWSILKGIRQYIIPWIWYSKDFSCFYGGKWAVITGASEGIGRAYAFSLAARNMNVVLIARNLKKLQEVAKEINEKYKVAVKCYKEDLMNLNVQDCHDKLEKEISNIDVGILVNNVGTMQDTLSYHLTLEKHVVDKIMELNMKTLVTMTNLVLPQMLHRKNGAIINISSGVTVHPTPLMTLYCASKKFVDFFIKGLRSEYQSEGLTIQLVNPFYVSTKLNNYPNTGFIVANPRTYAESALRTLGISEETNGCLSHAIMYWVGYIMPERLYMLVCLYINPYIWQIVTNKSALKGKIKSN